MLNLNQSIIFLSKNMQFWQKKFNVFVTQKQNKTKLLNLENNLYNLCYFTKKIRKKLNSVFGLFWLFFRLKIFFLFKKIKYFLNKKYLIWENNLDFFFFNKYFFF